MFVLDTNVVSELRKVHAGKGDRVVAAWANGADLAAFFLSSISIMEFEIGVSLMERRDARQGWMLRAWFEQSVLPAFDGRILPVDSRVALRCAKLHVPGPAAERDALIGATALLHGMILVTRNVSDFQRFSVPIFNPWKPG